MVCAFAHLCLCVSTMPNLSISKYSGNEQLLLGVHWIHINQWPRGAGICNSCWCNTVFSIESPPYDCPPLACGVSILRVCESQAQDIGTGYKAKPHEVTNGSFNCWCPLGRLIEWNRNRLQSQAATSGRVVLDVLWLKVTPSSSKSSRGSGSPSTSAACELYGQEPQ